MLKPIGSGYALSPSSLERSILESYLADCHDRHKTKSIELTLALNASGINNKPSLHHIYRDRILLAEKFERCRIALSPGPIRCLPPEILSEVFRYSLPPQRRPDPSTAPLLLCRVSSLWRNVAHTTRDLWNQLDFTCESKPDLSSFISSVPASIHRTAPLHQWLSHTRTSQLDLSFNRSRTGIFPDLVSLVLLPNAADIFRLEIHLNLKTSQGPFQHFSLLPPHTLHSLKFLILAQGISDAQVTVFQSPPGLSHLLIDELDFAVDLYEPGEIPSLHPIFPWAQLTYIIITRCIEPEIFFSALSCCHCLEVALFSVDLRGNSGGDDDSSSDSEEENGGHNCRGHHIPRLDQPIVLRCLRELDVIVGCGRSFPFEDFYFPALRVLRLQRGHMPQVPQSQQRLAAGRPDHFTWKNSSVFLSKLPSLNILSLVGRLGSVEEILAALRHIPSVDFLDLNVSVDHSALLRALTVGPQASPTSIPLPHLSWLQLLLEPGDMSSFSEGALRDMALSRSQQPLCSRLENISFASSRFSQEHFKNIKMIVENASSYVNTNMKVEKNASRVVPYRRCTGQSLWR